MAVAASLSELWAFSLKEILSSEHNFQQMQLLKKYSKQSHFSMTKKYLSVPMWLDQQKTHVLVQGLRQISIPTCDFFTYKNTVRENVRR